MFMRLIFYAILSHSPLLLAKAVGTSFNIRNSSPHKSQKAKVALETNRAKEFQRETAGALESAKEGWGGLAEGFGLGLGAGCRRFESCHSDQFSLKNRLFRRFFLITVRF